MSFYESLRDNTATKLIKKYGVLTTFKRVARGAYDPASGGTTSTTSTFTAYAVREEITKGNRADGAIQEHDYNLIAEASGGFLVNDVVVVDGSDHTVIRVDEIKPGAVVVAYNLAVKK